MTKPAHLHKRNWREVLQTLQPFLDPHKLSLSIVFLMLLLNGMFALGLGFAVVYLVDNMPADPAAASTFIDQALAYALLVILLASVFRYIHTYLLVKTSSRVIEEIRTSVFSNIADQPVSFFDNQHSGDLQTRIVADVNVVGQFVGAELAVNLSSFIRLLGGVIGAGLINLKLMVAVLLGLPLLFIPFMLFARRIRQTSKQVQTATAEAGRFAGESFRNAKLVQAYNNQQSEKQRFRSRLRQVVQQLLYKAKLEAGVSVAVNALALTGAAFLLWFCARNIHLGLMTVGELVTFSYFVSFTVIATTKFVSFIASLNAVLGSAEKIVDFLLLDTNSWQQTNEPLQISGNICFDKVYFSYPKRAQMQVLNGVELSVAAGRRVAIVGTSGSGKSTLFELLLRFYPAKQGDIYLDGRHLEEYPLMQLRQAIGFVPQKESLVSGTVLDNIRYGAEHIAESEVIRVAAELGIDSFIKSLPHGYHTELGEVGSRLSGGQKQRLALARALVREPAILLLDEANSALDKETDRFISRYIHSWAAQRHATVLTIAHRLETARLADEIVVMDEGLVVGQGTHDQLLLDCPLYRKLLQGAEQQAVAANGALCA